MDFSRIPTKYVDWAIIAVIIVFSLLQWFPTRFLPFHWDSAGFVAFGAQDLLERNFTPFVARGSDFAYPPLFVALVALVWELSSNHILASHLLMFPFLPMLAISTYFLGKKTHSRTVGLLAAGLVAFTPAVLAEYGVIYPDLATGAVAIFALLLWVYGYRLVSALVFTIALLFKPTVLLLLPAFIFSKKDSTKKENWIRLLPLLMPLLTLAAWFAYHFSVEKWLFTRPNRPSAIVKSISNLIDSAFFVGETALVAQGRWLILIASVLVVGAYVFFKNKLPKVTYNTQSFLFTIVFTLFLFAIGGEFIDRYIIFLFPLIYLSQLGLVSGILKSLKIKNAQLIVAGIGLSAAALFVLSWHPERAPTDRYELRPPMDLSYQDMIAVFRHTAAYAEYSSPDALFYGAFPENLYFTKPYLGYVKEPLNLNLCRYFKYDPEQLQILVLHAYSMEQMHCRTLMDAFSVLPVQRFELNGKWVELYEVQAPVATNSANQNKP